MITCRSPSNPMVLPTEARDSTFLHVPAFLISHKVKVRRLTRWSFGLRQVIETDPLSLSWTVSANLQMVPEHARKNSSCPASPSLCCTPLGPHASNLTCRNYNRLLRQGFTRRRARCPWWTLIDTVNCYTIGGSTGRASGSVTLPP